MQNLMCELGANNIDCGVSVKLPEVGVNGGLVTPYTKVLL